jgi:hypothetical protein
MTIKIGGSLIVAVPMRSGVVVSAESRREILLGDDSFRVLDGVQKIHSLKGRDDLVFFATGNSLVMAPLPPNVDADYWISNGVIRYDVISVLRQYLIDNASRIIDANYTQLAANYFKQHVTDALTEGPNLFVRAQKPLFEISLVQYDAALGSTAIGHFNISYHTSGAISVGNLGHFTRRRSHTGSFYRSGFANVAKLPDFRVLAPAGYFERGSRLQQTLIGDNSEEDARRFAREYIDTAIKVAALDEKQARQVGGPIYSYTVDGLRSLAEISMAGEAIPHAEQPQPLADDLHRKG